MSRRDITIRQWGLVRELQGLRSGLRTVDLAERLGVSRATVDRDLDELRRAGFPLERNSINGEVRHRYKGEALPPLTLTHTQAVALRMARAQLAPFEGTDIVRELDGLLSKLSSDQPTDNAHTVAAHVSQAPRHAVDPRTLHAIERALLGHRQLELRYRAASRSGQEMLYTIDPLRLRWVGDHLYLCAYVPERGDARKFKVIRIVAAKVLRTPAQHHPEWTDDRLFKHAVKIWNGEPVDVSVRLSPEVAHLAAEYPLIPDQRIDSRPDGSALVHAHVAGLVEARRWVLSWGGSAEAVAPPALREAIRDDLETALQRYLRKPARRATQQVRSSKLSDDVGIDRASPRHRT